MLNAIRIFLAVIMAVVTVGLIFALITFSIGYRSQSPLNIERFLAFAAITSLPVGSAWLLLFPRTKKQAMAGLVLALIFLACYLLFRAVASQIIFRT